MISLPMEESKEHVESDEDYQDEDFDESSDDELDDNVAEKKPDELKAAEMEALHSLTEQDIEGGDTDLILFRVPRHTRLRGALKGSKFNISVAENVIDKKLAVYQGSYVFRDRGRERCEHVRPVFVAENKNGKPFLLMGKKFSRFVTVTFDMKLSSLGDQRPMSRIYPKTKENMKLKYHPLGKVLSREHFCNRTSVELDRET